MRKNDWVKAQEEIAYLRQQLAGAVADRDVMALMILTQHDALCEITRLATTTRYYLAPVKWRAALEQIQSMGDKVLGEARR